MSTSQELRVKTTDELKEQLDKVRVGGAGG